ncbi:helix-turn-helix domain-containing protein, partial [Streptomyces sp. NPDC006324]|uniref:TetR/AcrR family transcriptional regulator n=1 Tax=Streptomyces sp. NPDC006324 TaxID=3156751 RepID=UPI0033BA73D3
MAGTARRRDGHVTQERMLEEAMAAIAEDGLASLTMSALAERLGTSGGHILYYFGSKDLLLLAALRWSEAALAEERRALLGRRVTAERKLDLFLRLYLPRGPRNGVPNAKYDGGKGFVPVGAVSTNQVEEGER